jgi:hypothetical protein
MAAREGTNLVLEGKLASGWQVIWSSNYGQVPALPGQHDFRGRDSRGDDKLEIDLSRSTGVMSFDEGSHGHSARDRYRTAVNRKCFE